MLYLLACVSEAPEPTDTGKPAETGDSAGVDSDSAADTEDSGGEESGDTGESGDTADSGGSDTEDTGAEPCAAACDDGLDCTEDTCDGEDRCIHSPLEDCAWPASLPPEVTALADLDEDFAISLSGATWNAETRALWVVRGDGATAWRLVEDGSGGWEIEAEGSLGSIDAESVVLADPVGAPEVLHVLVELEEVVTAFDLSGEVTELRTWDTSPWLATSGSKGSEGMAFVPDDALSAWGFVDEDGNPRVSSLGYGGLFFVGTQNGGEIHVFDLSATDDTVEHVGAYATARTDTSGLDFDAGTGRLYVWHGGDDDDLEIVRLSSSGDPRGFDTEMIFDYPDLPNIEGIALEALDDCADGTRSLFLTIDDGQERALDVYTDWPICGL